MFKVKQSRTFITMTNYHILDINLSIEAKGLQTWFLSNVKSWDGTFEDILKHNKNLTKEKLLIIINELNNNGYIEVDKKGNYQILDKPKNVTSKDLKPIVLDDVNKEEPNTKHKNLFDKCNDYINNYTNDPELRAVLREYLLLRLNPGAGTRLSSMPLQYFNQWRNLLINLDTLSGNKVNIVKQSISNKWAKFVDVKISRDGVKSNTYTKDEIEGFRKKAKELEEKGEQGVF